MKVFKSILIFVSAISAISSFAASKVGDQVLMQGRYSLEGVSQGASLVQSISSFNENTNSFVVEEKQTIGAEVRTKSKNTAADDVISEEAAEQIVANCESGIGKKETLQVKAGKYTTCHSSSGSGSEIWVGSVPFGLVKMISKVPTGGTITLELVSYKKGP